MSKSTFPQAVRDEYKQREREIKIKGELKIPKSSAEPIEYTTFEIGEGTTHQSSNLLPEYQGEYEVDTIYGHFKATYNNGVITLKGNLDFQTNVFRFQDFPMFSLPQGTYTLSLNHISGNTQDSHSQYIDLDNSELPGQDGFRIYFDDGTDTGNYDSFNRITMSLDRSYHYDDTYTLMLNEGTEAMPFEKSGIISAPQILDFDADEKSDIYYESMPFSELNLEVDNTDGYFSDFTDNSIVDSLNKECYIDFYLNVNNTGWCKAWTMQFDTLTADNQKAKLTFKPYCSFVINTEQIYDKNKYFLNNFEWNLQEFDIYMKDNYDINIEQDETNSGLITVNDEGTKDIKGMLLEFGSAVANLEKGQILTIKDNKILRYKLNTRSGIAQEDLTENELLDKPLISKEILKGIVKRFKQIKSYTSESINWQKQVEGILKDNTDVLVIYGDDFDMTYVSSNDITITNATLISVNHTTTGALYGLGSHYLIIEITGNVGDRYTIEINANIPRVQEVSEHEEIYAKGTYQTTEDFIKLNVSEIINEKYWTQLVDNMEKKIELQIKALPYLQVGDTISIPGEGNVVIAEIHTSWSDGFKMKIIAYKVKYTLY